jgi:hypothetical protein
VKEMVPNRNDACPCGSGKKYKKCCMNRKSLVEVKQVKEERFFQKKQKLVEKMTAFLHKEIPYSEMTRLKSQFHKRVNHSIQGGYKDGWSMFCLLFFHRFENGLRGVEWFYETNLKVLEQDLQEMLETWTKLKPRLIQTVDHVDTGVIVEDLSTKERLQVSYSDALSDFSPWSGCICLLEQFEDRYFINGVTSFVGPKEVAKAYSKVIDIMENTNKSFEETITANYPELLSTLLNDDPLPKEDKVASIHSETTLFYKIQDKEKLVDCFIDSDLFMFDEWENGNGIVNLCGSWYQYNDSLVEGSITLGEVLATLTVKDSSLQIVASRNEVVEKCKQMLESLRDAVHYIKQDVKTTKVPFHAEFMKTMLFTLRERFHVILPQLLKMRFF